MKRPTYVCDTCRYSSVEPCRIMGELLSVTWFCHRFNKNKPKFVGNNSDIISRTQACKHYKYDSEKKPIGED